MVTTLKPQDVRIEFYTFDKAQTIDLGNPCEIEFLNYGNSAVIINNILILTNKEDAMATKPTLNADWRQKFPCYPNEINKTQWNIRFEVIRGEIAPKFSTNNLIVVCKYYVYN